MKITPSPTIEETASFNESVLEEKVNSSRVIVILASLLFIVYTFMDSFGLPAETLTIIYPIRGFLLLVFAILLVLTLNRTFFTKYYVTLLMFGYICAGIVVTIGVYISQPGDYSYDLYFPALMMLAITSFSWSYLSIKNSIFISVFFGTAYVIIKVFFHQDTEGERLLTLLTHIFYLICVVIVASIAQYIRDNLIHKNLRLQKRLKVIAQEKTKEAEHQAKLANLDVLTGISNRRHITERLNKALKEAEEANTLLILIFMDLNGFKAINDTYGHDSGDKVLEVTAKRLQRSIRENDYLARLGGDEFLLGFKANFFSTKFVDRLCENLKNNISAPIAFNKNMLQVGVSIGYASYPGDGFTIEDLIKVADKQMYIDKQEIKRAEGLA